MMNFKFNRLFSYSSQYFQPIVKYSIKLVTSSDIGIGSQMRLLNKNGQFEEVLKLFDRHNNENKIVSSSIIMTQALKACTALGNFQRGITIYNLSSSNLKNDSYVLASFIHLQSKVLF